MTSALRNLLKLYDEGARTNRDKGTYFENVAKVFLENDPVQRQRFEKVWEYRDWALENGLPVSNDTGIDLVAKLRGSADFCAIQCKFYKDGKRLSKADVDTFFSASSKKFFRERLLIDTTDGEWGKYAEDLMLHQSIPTSRISLSDIEASPIDWLRFVRTRETAVMAKRQPFPFQLEAIEAVRQGFEKSERGKLLMPCGTGKTFTSLKIAEAMAGPGKIVLYMVPSLALMSQSITAWSRDTETALRCFAACSDSQVGKRRIGEDSLDIDMHDLAFPATTDAQALAEAVYEKTPDSARMSVVFATYQSIDVLRLAQQQYGMRDFDIIFCDEAHRTTGIQLPGEENASVFTLIHDQNVVRGHKRLYMTATPRIFGEKAKSAASEASVPLCSMDDEALYGQTFFERSFSWAVQNNLLSDYKVIVLGVDEGIISSSVQKRLQIENNSLKLDDATKIIGCYKALAKVNFKPEESLDPQPMKRALAFCRDIDASTTFASEFDEVVREYVAENVTEQGQASSAFPIIECEVEHVDGTFKAKERTRLLDWLKAPTEDGTTRVLSNARCLAEGVDVPALDAILFIHPRKSQIDIVQAVGRVMRKAEGKKIGYVVLPIVLKAGEDEKAALDNNEKYRVIWQVLNALRAHDDRFDAAINSLDLNEGQSDRLEIVVQSDQLPVMERSESRLGMGSGGDTISEPWSDGRHGLTKYQYALPFDEFTKAILAKIVKKCGTRPYWEQWAASVGKVAQTHITRISSIIAKRDGEERQAFDAFLSEIRDDLNDGVTEDDAVEMLAQHIITRPVFNALFKDYDFASRNPVSRAMQNVLDKLDRHHLQKETGDLDRFYAEVRVRAADIKTAEARQKILANLYDSFFRKAFPRMTEKLGIVYTPVEVVDFIIHSVNDILKSGFGQTLGSKGVHIIDPFTGTGTFITRLLQSGLIRPEELEHKYRHEIHANEIVLLAYYIAAINIESSYHAVTGNDYTPFEGICLTDTFQMYETARHHGNLLEDNSSRRQRQRKLDIQVIVGNPPYSVGQTTANDNNGNAGYPELDHSIRQTYAANSSATNKNALYDSYIRAIRWGSTRIGRKGIMAYVSNAGWLDASAMDGLRKCLAEEFSSMWIFNLRGNARTSGELRRKEKDNVFGMGTRTPIAVAIFVKNPDAPRLGEILYCDIGDYLNRDQKLQKIASLGSVNGISKGNGWRRLKPDAHHDWLAQRDDSFTGYMIIGDKKGTDEKTLFNTYSAGVKTQRDAWCYNSSKASLRANVERFVAFYNAELERYLSQPKTDKPLAVEDFISNDSRRISWSRALVSDFEKRRKLEADEGRVILGLYRPFTKQHLYFSRRLNEMIYQTPRLFPNAQLNNRVIAVSGVAARSGFSALMTNKIPCLDMIEKGQCFPLRIYDEPLKAKKDLFAADTNTDTLSFCNGISDEGLAHFLKAYPNAEISKEDIFYYVYGLLHSPQYRAWFANNLAKELPRIPCVRTFDGFKSFRDAGRALGELHVNFETVAPYPVTISQGSLSLASIPDPVAYFRVEKMKFGKKDGATDKTQVIYNPNITMTNIPLEAYDYVVNGKPALEWVMERQGVRTDKDSGIVNDANLYATETIGNPAYPLELFQRVITVSLETNRIVHGLPVPEI